MKISIFGLGYVGSVSAACLAEMGHSVIGVDINQHKLDKMRKGRSPIIEPGLDALFVKGVRSGRLSVTGKADEAIKRSDVSMICVGTPSKMNGKLDTRYLKRVSEQIGNALMDISKYHVVTIRSTVLPGILQDQIIPLLEAASGKKVGKDFDVCLSPEFLREGTSIQDFFSPPFTLIGEINKSSGDILEEVYGDLSVPIYRVEPDVAAMVKYASNAYHALKVAFANEIGAICRDLSVNSQQVMDIFVQDKQLNTSKLYLRPGFAFGGSCLPKDIRALLDAAEQRHVNTSLISSILPSNDQHLKRAVDLVVEQNKRKVALLGLSFKTGSDDVRESPMLRLAEALIAEGFRLNIYDEDVRLANLLGQNREYIENVLPDINRLLRTDLEDIIKEADVLIVGKKFPHLEKIRPGIRENHVVIDLIGSGNWKPAKRIELV